MGTRGTYRRIYCPRCYLKRVREGGRGLLESLRPVVAQMGPDDEIAGQSKAALSDTLDRLEQQNRAIDQVLPGGAK